MNNFINIFEMSPRDGLQNEKKFITTDDKIKFIKGHFTDFELDEKVDIAIMHGAFHHVFIEDMEPLFKKIRQINELLVT